MNSFNLLFLALFVAMMAAMKVEARLEGAAQEADQDHRALFGMKTTAQKQDVYKRCCVESDETQTQKCHWGASNDMYPNCCCPVREWSFFDAKWEKACSNLATELNL